MLTLDAPRPLQARRSSRLGHPARGGALWERVRDRHDPKRIRYGCFLPDLTGLATAPPMPAPRGGYIRSPAAPRKSAGGCFSGLSTAPIEPAGRNARRLVIGAGGKALADDGGGFHRHRRRHHAGKVGMQGAARVGEAAVIVIMQRA